MIHNVVDKATGAGLLDKKVQEAIQVRCDNFLVTKPKGKKRKSSFEI